MFEKFTDRARKVMALANQEAQRFNHKYIGTEHILLGLIKQGTGVGANVLKNLGMNLHKVRLGVEELVKPGPDIVTMGKLPQTGRAKKVVEFAILEARNLNHNYVGTEHLLLGLLREHEGTAAQVLVNMGLRLEQVREEVIELLGAGITPEEYDDESTESDSKNLPPDLLQQPLYEYLTGQIEELAIQKDKAVKAADYELAAELRNKAESIRRRLEQYQRAFLQNPDSFISAVSPINKLAEACTPNGTIYLRKQEAKKITADLISRKFVLVVAVPGSGKSEIFGGVAHHLIEQADGPVPLTLYYPMHDVLNDNQPGPENAKDLPARLDMLLDLLQRTQRTGLALPDIDQLADQNLYDEMHCDAWRSFVSVVVEEQVPSLATCTPQGFQRLESAWPGLTQACVVFPLTGITEQEAISAVQMRLDKHALTHPVQYEDGLEHGIVIEAKTWPPTKGIAEPGRSLMLTEKFLAYAANQVKPDDGQDTAFYDQAHRIKERIKAHTDQEEFDMAIKLSQKLHLMKESRMIEAAKATRSLSIELTIRLLKKFVEDYRL